MSSGLQEAGFGSELAAAGDVNGDGLADVVIAAPDLSDPETDEGGVWVFLGTPSGLAATPVVFLASDHVAARLGQAVASAGDVDGDGFDDLLVGSPTFDLQRRGAVFVVPGSPTGPRLTATRRLDAPAAWDGFGSAVSSAGDVDGDGYDDVLVGAPDAATTLPGEGAAYLFRGGPNGIASVPTWTVSGGMQDAQLGAVVGGFDVNGDGFEDVAVGARLWGLDHEGSVRVFHGSANGLSAVPQRTLVGSPGSTTGALLAAAGDVNGDGFDDLLVGDDTSVSLYLGGAGGLEAVPVHTFVGASSAGGGGDLDGDGFDDVVVGRPETPGRAEAYLGFAGGVRSTPAWIWASTQDSSRFGEAAAVVGDVDGDGHADVLIGSPRWTETLSTEGAAFLALGEALADTDGDGLVDVVDLCPAAVDPAQLDDDGDGVGNACDTPTLEVDTLVAPGVPVTLLVRGASPGESVHFAAAPGTGGVGPCLAALGGTCLDLGAPAVSLGAAIAGPDGVARRIVALPAGARPAALVIQASIRRGAGGSASVTSPVLVVDGTRLDHDADGLSNTDEQRVGTDPLSPDTDGDGLLDGAEVAAHLDPSSPDTDGDGVSDAVDVCAAGDDLADVDGDGVADACDGCVVDSDPGQVDTDGDGLGDVCDVEVLGPVTWQAAPGLPGSGFGGALAAGDVNGDGFDDLLVGAESLDLAGTGAGGAYLYLGSAAGPSTNPDWRVTGSRSWEQLGGAVAFADVDGDGFDDVLVGASGVTDPEPLEGAILVHMGSPSGVDALPAVVLEGDTRFARFGSALASAGDVDGDGFDDVIVGAPQHGYPSYLGAAHLFRGSAVGLVANPAWTVVGEELAGELGSSVAAGDFDGDGYSDLVVGSKGGVRVFRGSASGPETVASWAVTDPEPTFGARVATADIDGDGYDELLVGAPGAGTHDGVVRVYVGSALGLGAAPTWTRWGVDGMGFGDAVGSAGDVDGDGFEDVVVGAPSFDGIGGLTEGATHLFLGTPGGLAEAAVWSGTGGVREGRYGASVGGGDLDGDGLSDVVIGSLGQANVTVRPGASTVGP